MKNEKIIKISLISLFVVFVILLAALTTTFAHHQIRDFTKILPFFLIYVLVLGYLFLLFLAREKKGLKDQRTKLYFLLISNIILLFLILLPHLNLLEKAGPLKVFYKYAIFFRIAGLSLITSFFTLIFIPKKLLDRFKVKKNSIYYLIAFFALAYTILGFLKYNVYAFSALDFGIAIQGIWHYSEFKLAYTTLAPTIPEGGLLWGEHFHSIWVFITPFFWLWKDPRTLLVVEAIIVCFGALPIFWLAKKFLKNNLGSLIIASAYLFFFGIQYALNFPFRGDTLGTTFLAFAIYYLIDKKWGRYSIFVLLALMCKENFSIYVVFLGIYALLRKNFVPGLITIFFGLGWYFFFVNYFIPQMNIDGTYGLFTFTELGPNLPSALKNIVIHPWRSILIFFRPMQKVFAMLSLFSSLSFLPFLAPSALILAIPMLAERFFSSGSHFWETCFHYSVTITPALFFAAILGSKKIKKWGKMINLMKSKKRIVISLALGILLSSFFVSLFLEGPLFGFLKKNFYQKLPQEKVLKEAYELLPEEASISAQCPLVPRIAKRRNIFQFPYNFEKSEYIFLDTKLNYYPLSKKNELVEYINKLQKSKNFGLIFSKESVLIFKKGSQDNQELTEEVLKFLREYNK